jgi:hypothetical protein
VTKKELLQRIQAAKESRNHFECLQLQVDAIREYITAPAARKPAKRRR